MPGRRPTVNHRRVQTERNDQGSESGVALLTAIFFMVLAAGMSVVLLGAILSQGLPARTAQKNTRTVYSAEAGLQNALGLIRSAAKVDGATGKVFGDPGQLPCTVKGRVTASAPQGAYYAVTVQYFSEDPTDQDDAWRAAKDLPCATPGGVASVPKYAYVYSGGKDATMPTSPDDGDRALSAVYKFQVSNANIPGGMIWNSSSTYCLEAKNDKNNPNIDFVPKSECTGTNLQLWSYSTDYQLVLASTNVAGQTARCITGPKDNKKDKNKNEDEGKQQKARLEDCLASTDAARWNQLWNWTGDYSWRGQNENIASGPSNYCLSPDTADASTFKKNTSLYARPGCNGSFAPSSLVGAGAAGYTTHQLVNYAEFGRCADVTNEQIGSPFMISYPCKQDPSGSTTGAYLKWNHKWYYTEPPEGSNGKAAPQQIFVNYLDNTANKRCLTAPPLSSTTGDLTFEMCSASLSNQLWTRWNHTGNDSTSYLMIDTFGRCMFADSSDLFNSYYSKVRVTACDGSLRQKWNAPAIYEDSTFGGYREVAK